MNTKKRCFLGICLLLFSGRSMAQYFYQDIWNTRQTSHNMALLKEKEVRVQEVQSLDANMETDNDFRCQRLLSSNGRQLRSITQSSATGLSIMTSSFSARGLLTKTVDSTESSITTIQYRYDTAGRLVDIHTVSQSQAAGQKFRISETRSYQYNQEGHLASMVHKKSLGGADSTTVLFKTDAQGRVTEEQEYGKNIRSPRIYYNYDSQGRLTDVLRYHAGKKRMLPDYMFEYDAQQRLSQMTTVNAETSDYTIWKYQYDDKGLPSREECYGKQKALLGIVKYKYEFNQLSK
jgi:YD repeat-containing protein